MKRNFTSLILHSVTWLHINLTKRRVFYIKSVDWIKDGS